MNEHIEDIRHELGIQLQRMAQIQHQLDRLTATLSGLVERTHSDQRPVD